MLFVLTHSPLDIDGNLTKICLDSTSRISAYSKNYLKIFNQFLTKAYHCQVSTFSINLIKNVWRWDPCTSDRLEHPCIDFSEQFAVDHQVFANLTRIGLHLCTPLTSDRLENSCFEFSE